VKREEEAKIREFSSKRYNGDENFLHIYEEGKI